MRKRIFLFFLFNLLFISSIFSELPTDKLLRIMQNQLPIEDLGDKLFILTLITEDQDPDSKLLFILTTNSNDIPLYVGAINSNGAMMPIEKRKKEEMNNPIERRDMKLWKIPLFVKGVVFNTSGEYKIVKLRGTDKGNYNNGGKLQLNYMVSGPTGLRKKFTFNIVKIKTKNGIDWKLFSDENTGKKIVSGKRIDHMHFVVNNFLWVAVGIKKVLFNDKAKKRFLNL